jgi:hypothetical protein
LLGLSQLDDLPISGWFRCHSLLGEAIKQVAPAARLAPVEAEYELVQVILKMFDPDGSLMRPQ